MEWLPEGSGSWIVVVVGLLAIAESGLFVGLVVPGETVMLLGGVLASQGRAPLVWVIAAACLGGVVGDSVSYEIGSRFGPRLVASRFGRWVGDDRWGRARDYMRTRGGRSVFFGRFVGIFRALVPAIAGWARMPYGSFLVFNVAGGVVWGTSVILLGVAAGASWALVERWLGMGGLLLAALASAGLGLLVLIGWRRGRSRADGGPPRPDDPKSVSRAPRDSDAAPLPGSTSRTVWVSSHRCPLMSSTTHERSPYSYVVGSSKTQAPASRARAKAASTSGTRTLMTCVAVPVAGTT